MVVVQGHRPAEELECGDSGARRELRLELTAGIGVYAHVALDAALRVLVPARGRRVAWFRQRGCDPGRLGANEELVPTVTHARAPDGRMDAMSDWHDS